MNVVNKFVGVMVIGLSAVGCATTSKLSEEQIQQKYTTVAQLEQAMQSARGSGVDVLAPLGFASAEKRLAEAYAAANRGQAATVDRIAKQGLETISRANRDSANSADILGEVMDARANALRAGAHDLFPKDLNTLEKDLRDTAALIEKGELEDAKSIRPELRQRYADLELKSVKEGTVQRAKAAIARARDNDAHKLAPKTFKSAEESLAAAVSVLEADRTARDRAEVAAQQALTKAERSEYISEMVRDFDRRDYTSEDIVLWYQDQLAKLAGPLDKKLTFNETNKDTVGGLRQDIAALVQDRQHLAETEGSLAKANAAIAELKQQHAQEIAQIKSEFAGEKTELTQAQKEREERFRRVQNMFSADEATVYRQGDNVLISVHGFKFPTGSSEIQPQNFGIMNKIVQGINTFRAAKIEVGGHTDSTGSNEINLGLSEQRAKSVAQFLTDVGHIPADKIVAEGFGAERPVATNATPEGRAENRRIEVVIVNE